MIKPASLIRARIWAEVYGPEYPAAADPFSYVSVSELDRFAATLAECPHEMVVDLACGMGGPGLWVAGRLGAAVTGIDPDEDSLAVARDRAAELGIPADYRPGTFDATGLPDAGADAVMSVDALLFAPDKVSAVRELARILRPGGRAVITTWDYHSQPVGRPPQVDDHRPILTEAGLTVLAYAETADWRDRQTLTTQGMLNVVEDLAQERGRDVDELRAAIEEMRATFDTILRRVLIVAERG